MLKNKTRCPEPRLFLARRLGINIDSLTVGPTENEEIARMTIVAHTTKKERIARGQP